MWTQRLRLANTLIVFALALLFTMVVHRFYAQQQNTFHVLSGVNLYERPVEVIIDDSTYKLQPFEMYHHYTKTSQTRTVTVREENGDLLAARTRNFGAHSTLWFDSWGINDLGKNCAVLADITPLYYEPNSLDRTFQYRVLAGSPATGIGYSANGENIMLIPPGLDYRQALPLYLESDTRIRGVYPLPCTDVDDAAAVGTWVSWWHTYNAETQLELLTNERERIRNSKRYVYPER